jgi:hypothetical protein
VVNNVNGEAFVYRNNARALHGPATHFLQVRLEGAGANRFGVGARVTLRAGGERHAGAGAHARLPVERGLRCSPSASARARAVDSLTVEWPDGRTSTCCGRGGRPAR